MTGWSGEHNVGVHTFDDVFVNHEGLIFKRGQIYPESFTARMYGARYRRENSRGWFLVKNYWLRRGSVNVRSGLWAIDNFSPDNYYHWLMDVLPRLVLAEDLYPTERVLLLPRYYGRQAYIEFTLRAFPRIERVVWIEPRTKMRVRRLAYVPRLPVYVRELIGEVARRVGDTAGASGESRRIYFSRADAHVRRARNEKDLIRVLRSHDFEIIRIDPAKPWEQVRASLGAQVIAGVHGAALTNLIFMPAGGKVIELRHGYEQFFFRAYEPLARMMGFGYRAQVCELADEAEGYEINKADLIVDLDQLRETLREATAA